MIVKQLKLPDHFTRRLIVMAAGLFLSALGVSFSIKAELGASPLGCCPAVFSPALGFSVGTGVWILCFIAIAVQVAVLRRRFSPVQLLQIPMALFYGYMTDLTMLMISPLPDGGIFRAVLYCVLGIVLLGGGIFVTMAAELLCLSPDAALRAISEVSGWPYSRLKIIMDCFLVASATVGSLLLYGRLYQVGVGTFAGAVLVGAFIGFLKSMGAPEACLRRFMRSPARQSL